MSCSETESAGPGGLIRRCTLVDTQLARDAPGRRSSYDLDRCHCVSTLEFLGRVPDRRGIGPLCHRRGGARQRLHAEPLRVMGRPARCGNLDDAAIVRGRLAWVEVRIVPHGDELGRADGIGPARVCHIHCAADGRQLAVAAGLAVAGPGDVVDLFVEPALGVEPALDDLVAVEIGSDRILQRDGQERWATYLVAPPSAHPPWASL